MITSLCIRGAASYPAEGVTLNGLKQVNFLFGHNGCGKTTVSRAIAAPAGRDEFRLDWRNGRPLVTRVYNSDFITANYGDQMPGIFTLGEDGTRAAEAIEALQQKIGTLNASIDQMVKHLDGTDGTPGKRAELAAARAALEAACWESQKAHKEYFARGFTPHRANKTAFCDKLLAEHEANTSELLEVQALQDKSATVFDDDQQSAAALPVPSFDRFAPLTSHAILARQIVGRDDVVVAGLIDRLGSSDWVREGMGYLAGSGEQCPFCQQQAPVGLLADLNAFFDETYERDLGTIRGLHRQYEHETTRLRTDLDDLLNRASPFVDSVELSRLIEVYAGIVELNLTRIASKVREPSATIELQSVDDVGNAIRGLVEGANRAVAAHNAMIANIAEAREEVKQSIWRFVVEERKTDVATYFSTADSVQRAIEGLETGIRNKRQQRDQAKRELEEAEAAATSVRPTVDAINRVLGSFGFTSFKLAVAGERDQFYRIERADGSSAALTLSEGERSFVTFLYFYHSIAGSQTSSGISDEKIVVFDDPVSSLDADVLFIVGSLVRKVITDMRNGVGTVRQVFVLTHNIYFHKEISYAKNRDPNSCFADETFWVVRKRDNVSAIQHYPYNPVRTSYEMLWDEVRSRHGNALTIQNTLRRIIENYLLVLGGWDRKVIEGLFDGPDQQLCAALFSWINDGSHGSNDELYLAADEAAVEGYMRVFEQVFHRTGQQSHYRMMMRLPELADEPAQEPVVPDLGDGAGALETA